MKTPTFTLRSASLALLALLSITRPAPAAESLSVLLQKAIYAEETEGNLDSAIKLYEQIATEGAANRALIAQAQYRLAVCFQKQGKKELAVAAFNEKRSYRSGTYSYEQRKTELDEPYLGHFKRNKAAFEFFMAQPPGYRKVAIWFVVSAKKEETRMQRLERLITTSAARKRLV